MGGPISLLHVEDEQDYSDLVSAYLQRVAQWNGDATLDIAHAQDVEQAIDLLEERRYDCVVTDYQLGNESGLTVLEAARKLWPGIPVIFLTGQGDEEVAREAFLKGANDYFSKDREFIAFDRIYNSICNHASLYEKDREHQKMSSLYEQDLNILASAGLDLLNVALDQNIIDKVTEHLVHLAGEETVVISLYDKGSDLFEVANMIEGASQSATARTLLLQLEGMTFSVHKDAMHSLTEGSFISFPATGEYITGGTIDARLLEEAMDALDASTVHVMPLVKSNMLYGIVTVLLPDAVPFRNKSLVEAYLVIASVAINRHITETNLLDQEKIYHEYISNAPDAVIVTNTKGECIDANPAATLLTGYEKKELMGRRVTQLVGDEYHEKAKKAFQYVNPRHKTNTELPLRCKDGRTKWVRIASITLDETRNMAFCRDISSQRRDVEIKDRLTGLLSSVRMLDREIVRASSVRPFLKKALKSLVENKAYNSGWIVWLSESGSFIEHIQHRTPHPIIFRDLLHSGNAVPCFNEALSKKDTIVSNHCENDICKACPLMATYPQNYSFTKRLECHGYVCGVLSLQLPDKYGRMEDEQRLFNEIAEEISFAMGFLMDKDRQERAEQALRMQRKELSDFTHIVSHDIKNDLFAIKSYAEMDDLPSNVRFGRISQKVDDLSMFVKKSVMLAEAGKVVGEPEPAHLGDIIESVIELFANKGIAITYGKMPVIWTDAVKMRETIINVIDNSVIHGQAKNISITAELCPQGMRIRFDDDGIGIQEDILPSLFEWGMSSKITNNGIGLAIIKHIVRAHGGVVAAWNNEVGSTISLRFPRSIVDMHEWDTAA